MGLLHGMLIATDTWGAAGKLLNRCAHPCRAEPQCPSCRHEGTPAQQYPKFTKFACVTNSGRGFHAAMFTATESKTLTWPAVYRV